MKLQEWFQEIPYQPYPKDYFIQHPFDKVDLLSLVKGFSQPMLFFDRNKKVLIVEPSLCSGNIYQCFLNNQWLCIGICNQTTYYWKEGTYLVNQPSYSLELVYQYKPLFQEQPCNPLSIDWLNILSDCELVCLDGVVKGNRLLLCKQSPVLQMFFKNQLTIIHFSFPKIILENYLIYLLNGSKSNQSQQSFDQEILAFCDYIMDLNYFKVCFHEILSKYDMDIVKQWIQELPYIQSQIK